MSSRPTPLAAPVSRPDPASGLTSRLAARFGLQADMLLPDGAGLVWALRRAGHARSERLSGADAMEQVLAAAVRGFQ